MNGKTINTERTDSSLTLADRCSQLAGVPHTAIYVSIFEVTEDFEIDENEYLLVLETEIEFVIPSNIYDINETTLNQIKKTVNPLASGHGINHGIRLFIELTLPRKVDIFLNGISMLNNG